MVDWSGGAKGPGIASDITGGMKGAHHGTSIDDVGAWYAENIDPNLSVATGGLTLGQLMDAERKNSLSAQQAASLDPAVRAAMEAMAKAGIQYDSSGMSHGVPLNDAHAVVNAIAKSSNYTNKFAQDANIRNALDDIAQQQAIQKARQEAVTQGELDSLIADITRARERRDAMAVMNAGPLSPKSTGYPGSAGQGGVSQNYAKLSGALGDTIALGDNAAAAAKVEQNRKHAIAVAKAIAAQKGPPVDGAPPGSVVKAIDDTTLNDHLGGYAPVSFSNLGYDASEFAGNNLHWSADEFAGVAPTTSPPGSLALGPPGHGFVSALQGGAPMVGSEGGGEQRRKLPRTADYERYVDLYDDLLAAQPGNLSKSDWGRRHWERHGGKEGRDFYGPSQITHPVRPDGTQSMEFFDYVAPPPFNTNALNPPAIANPGSANPVAYGNAFAGVKPRKSRKNVYQDSASMGWT